MQKREKLADEIQSLIHCVGADTITIKMSAADAAGLALDLQWCARSSCRDYQGEVSGGLQLPKPDPALTGQSE